MQPTRQTLWHEVLLRLRELHDEVRRTEEFVEVRLEAGASAGEQSAGGSRQSAAGQGEAAGGRHGGTGILPVISEEALGRRQSAALTAEAGSLRHQAAEAEAPPLLAAAPRLVAGIRAELAGDPLRALALAYPPGLFAPGAPPERTQRECLRRHALHTARLAMFVAAHHGYQPSTVEVVGLCALLHDFGLEHVAPELFTKAQPLTPPERLTLQAHASEGAERLRAEADLEGLLRTVVPRVVHQHHERADGSGYPEGLDEPHIHEFARLLALVEAYETMVSPRPYKEPCLPHEAMETLLLDAFGKRGPARYDKRLATSFLRALSLYPVASGVELEGGEVALVVGANPDAPDRPHVRVLWGPDGRRVERPRVLDLRRPGVAIARAIRLPRFVGR